VLIGDLVASRAAPSRPRLHDDLGTALAVANEACHPSYPLVPTVGDEFQGVFARAVDALLATLLVRASMGEGQDARFGLGVGEVVMLGTQGWPQDGPAWWAARDAVDYVAGGARRRGVPRTLRTWMGRPPGHEGDPGALDALNAFLITRDHLVTAMDGRNRRILRGLLLGKSLAEIGAGEGVTASAVSQRSTRSGATQIAFAQAGLAAAAG